MMSLRWLWDIRKEVSSRPGDVPIPLVVRVRAPTVSKERTYSVGTQVREGRGPAFKKFLGCSKNKQPAREA